MTVDRLEVDAVILDLDDTLISEHDYVMSGYAAVAESLAEPLGVPAAQLFRALTDIFESPNRSRAFDALLEPFGREDLVVRAIDTYRSHSPSIALTPSAELLLQHLIGRVPLGLVTDGPLVMQEAKVAALRLRERGIEVVFTDALGGREAWKPSPVGLLEVVGRLGVEPHRAVYLADNPHKDFLAAAAAGVHSVRFRVPGQLHEGCSPPPGGEPDQEINDLMALIDILALD